MIDTKQTTPAKTCAALMLESFGMPEGMINSFERVAAREDWIGIAQLMSFYDYWMAFTFCVYYPLVPESERYRFLISLYSYGGDSVGAIRKEVRSARKYGVPQIPEEYGDVITVYRAGTESINLAKYKLSWTVDLDKAKWFMDYRGIRTKYDLHLYQGEILREKVIAYNDQRKEREIIQYRNVRNIREIDFMSHDEAIDRWVKHRKKIESACREGKAMTAVS